VATARDEYRVCLLTVQLERLARARGIRLNTKGPTALGMKDAFANQLVDRGARLKRWVQLDERVRPEDACFELAANVLPDLRVMYLKEAPSISRVVVDQAMTKVENIHAATAILAIGTAGRPQPS
jgi:hypothetical protein